MTQAEYPQETLGTTLLDVTSDGERRRIYHVQRNGYQEIGEFTHGPLTQEIYGAPVHLHSIKLHDVDVLASARAFFSHDNPLLADYMDTLDAQGIPYGYMNSEVGKFVSYRPANA